MRRDEIHPEAPARTAWRILARIACAGALICLTVAPAQGMEAARESQLKAAFLYNFTRFVEWPAAHFPSETSPIRIGVLGPSAVYEELGKVTGGRDVNGRPIVVKAVSAAEAGSVDILFVPADAEQYLDAEPVAGVLTVGETERFAALGGMITFISDANRVRFMINLESAGRAHLKLSSQLLKLATVVRRKP